MSVKIEGGRSSAVMRALKGMPAARAAHTTNGRWDLVVELDTPSLTEFSASLDVIRAIEGISGSETSILLHSIAF